MLLKTVNVMLNVLVALTVWGAALMFALCIAIAGWHLLVAGGLTVSHLMHS
jgi:hypothetical protein